MRLRRWWMVLLVLGLCWTAQAEVPPLEAAQTYEAFFADQRIRLEKLAQSPRPKSHRQRMLEGEMARLLSEAKVIEARLDHLLLGGAVQETSRSAFVADKAIPVTDAVNFGAQITHLVERYYEIAQRILEIYNQLEQIVNQVRNLESLGEDIPFTDLLDAAENIYNTGLKAFELFRDEEYPGLVWSIPVSLKNEFEESFPGGESYELGYQWANFESGFVFLEGMRERRRLEGERALRALRSILQGIADQEGQAIRGNVDLSEMKTIMGSGKDGNVQALEVLAAIQAAGNEQESAGNLLLTMMGNAVIVGHAEEINARLRAEETFLMLRHGASEAVVQEYGVSVVPFDDDPNRPGFTRGLPSWVGF